MGDRHNGDPASLGRLLRDLSRRVRRLEQRQRSVGGWVLREVDGRLCAVHTASGAVRVLAAPDALPSDATGD